MFPAAAIYFEDSIFELRGDASGARLIGVGVRRRNETEGNNRKRSRFCRLRQELYSGKMPKTLSLTFDPSAISAYALPLKLFFTNSESAASES